MNPKLKKHAFLAPTISNHPWTKREMNKKTKAAIPVVNKLTGMFFWISHCENLTYLIRDFHAKNAYFKLREAVSDT